jgi:hypothetical protein
MFQSVRTMVERNGRGLIVRVATEFGVAIGKSIEPLLMTGLALLVIHRRKRVIRAMVFPMASTALNVIGIYESIDLWF